MAHARPGIAPEDLSRIFDPFWQVQQGATRASPDTGLDFPVALGMAELPGGRIRVRSTPSEGPVFTLELPVSPSA